MSNTTPRRFTPSFSKFCRPIQSGKITMVLDNARIHHACLLQPILEENRDRWNWYSYLRTAAIQSGRRPGEMTQGRCH